jgi:hypothetical protein
MSAGAAGQTDTDAADSKRAGDHQTNNLAPASKVLGVTNGLLSAVSWMLVVQKYKY